MTRDLEIPTNIEIKEDVEAIEKVQAPAERPLTKEESEEQLRVFFEEDETINLRDGKQYKIPPLGLKDAHSLMGKLNTIDTAVILGNMIKNEEGEDTYDELLETLHMAFKPYYPEVTVQHLERFVDIDTAKKIIDIMLGLNGLKKSL